MITCQVCHQVMTPYEEGQTRHPTCYDMGYLSLPPSLFEDPAGYLSGEEAEIKKELTDLILWADAEDPRHKQLAIGPSELGDKCDRRLAYRIAGIEGVNEYDPWPAIVGTSVHTWLEQAVRSYSSYTNSTRYLTEMTVMPDDLIIGHSDLYDARRKMIIDWKTVSSKNLAKFKAEGPPDSYITQLNLYGMGQVRAGRPVEKICIVALGRAGWLGSMYVWVDDYRPEVAQQALDRVYQLGARLLDLDITNHPHRWEAIEATPSNLCGWCPFYRQGPEDGQGANDQGCPGR